MSFQSKTKMSKCYYCGEVMKDENLKSHCKNTHGAAKRVAGERSVENFFTPPPSKVSKTFVESSSSTSGECLLASGGRQTPEDLLLTGPHTSEDIEDEPRESLEKDTANEDINEEPTKILEDDTVNELVKLVKDIAVKSGDSYTEIQHLRESITTLVSKLEKKIPEFAKPDDASPYDERIKLLQDCKTVDDITESFDELVVEEETDMILCELCFVENESAGARTPGQFKFKTVDETMDEGSKQSRPFINLKAAIKKHFKTTLHTNNWEAWKQKEDANEAFKSRVHEVGMRIARICYAGYKGGSSKRNFEQEILKAVLNGCDMGDINHSDQFPRKFRPFVKREIRNRTKKFLNSRLEQTGFEPALNISADKGTNVHRSRQFTTVKTCVPDSPNLINSVFLGHPVVKHHAGVDVTASIEEELKEFGIKSSQLEGASFDGAYFHQSVPEHLKASMDISEQFVATHDPLHITGIKDAHIRKDLDYSWLTKVQEICSEIYNKFNWGKNYELLLDTCKELEMTLASLTKFSKTRFANSIRNVTINIRKDFQVIVDSLKKIIDENKDSTIAKKREKATDAEHILKKITNKKFVLHLSGISDVYEVFGKVVNTCQIVDILPFERYDAVKKSVAELKEMVEHKDHSKCVESYKKSKDFVGEFPESDKVNGHCKWPSYHADLSDLQTHGKYRGVKISKNFEEKTVVTRLARKEGLLNVTKDAFKIAETEIMCLAKRLHDDLDEDIFEKAVVEKIEKTRTVCDLKSLARKIKEKGSVLEGTLSASGFVESSKQLTGTIENISDEVLENNYKKFVKVLENHVRNKKVENLTSKELVKEFLSTKLKLYEGVELTVHIICSAAIKVSVESDVESLVSRYEKHLKVDR